MSVSVDQSKLRHRQHDNFTRLGAELSKSFDALHRYLAYAHTAPHGMMQTGLQLLKDFNRD